MKFVIRVDDVGWSATEAPGRAPMKMPDPGLRIARKFHEAMGGVPYLAGVIPAVLDHDGANWIRGRPPGMTVALHGWSHEPSGSVRSEFHGMDPEKIRERIADGRRVVGFTSHFIPPFNAYDDAWGEPMWHEGIRTVWGLESRWPTPPRPEERGRQIFVPAWAPLYGATRWTQGSAEAPIVDVLDRYAVREGIAVLTLHVTWEAARDPAFEGVRELAGLIRDAAVFPDELLRELR